MKSSVAAHRRTALTLCAAGLLTAAMLPPAFAQTPATQPQNSTPGVTQRPVPSSANEYQRFMTTSVDRSYKLKYTQSPVDSNEILTAMRNMADPMTKIFMVPSTGFIVVHAPEDVQASLAKLLATLDVPHPRYRLTYTLTELDGSRKIGMQHFSFVVLVGQRTDVKQGSRIPITHADTPGAFSQVQYQDVGLNFEASLIEVQGGGILKGKVEQTSIALDPTAPSNQNPVIRQTVLEGTSSLLLNKPLMLGSLDVPASTRHFDIEVVMEPVI